VIVSEVLSDENPNLWLILCVHYDGAELGNIRIIASLSYFESG
jgi:hypothetical protein